MESSEEGGGAGTKKERLLVQYHPDTRLKESLHTKAIDSKGKIQETRRIRDQSREKEGVESQKVIKREEKKKRRRNNVFDVVLQGFGPETRHPYVKHPVRARAWGGVWSR